MRPPDLWAAHFEPPDGTWDDENSPAHFAAMKAAHERCKEYGRLYTRRGGVGHLVPPWASGKTVLCSVLPQWPDEWLGTGSQDEYKLAAEMSTCKRCHVLFMRSVKCGNPQCWCQWKTGFRTRPPDPP